MRSRPIFLRRLKICTSNEVREGIFILVEKMLVERGARNHFAAVKRKIFEDRVLARRERNRMPRTGNRASAGVDEHSAQFDLRPRLAGRATDQRPESSQQLGQIEGFDEIIVRSDCRGRERGLWERREQ